MRNLAKFTCHMAAASRHRDPEALPQVKQTISIPNSVIRLASPILIALPSQSNL